MSDNILPAIGEPPVLQWIDLAELQVDPAYQRGLANGSSQTLIRAMAREWNWQLCLPLSVSRRLDETLWVMDGQHRLTAARMRSDIPRLPCVITPQDSLRSEALTFVKLNVSRKGLGSVDVFKANVAAGVPEAIAVEEMIRDAGLTIAPHSNWTAWKPGMIYCIPGIQAAYRRHGRPITSAALVALKEAFGDQVLRYAGQLLRGLFIVYATEATTSGFDVDAFIDRFAMNTQQQWMRKANERMARTGESIAPAISNVLIDAYRALKR